MLKGVFASYYVALNTIASGAVADSFVAWDAVAVIYC